MYLNILKTAFTLLCLLELSQAAYLRCFNGSLNNFIEVPLDQPLGVLPLLTKVLTKLFVAGYRNKVNGPANTAMIEAFLSNVDWNACMLNWEKEAECPLLGATLGYPCACENGMAVGKQLGDTLVTLKKNGWNMEGLQVFGHSLGCHVAGWAGKQTQTQNETIPEIVGLDPAGPFFDNPPTYEPLDGTDAKRVRTVHTDAGDYGVRSSNVQLQIWPNTNKSGSQPGCPVGTYPRFSNESMCSHNRAWQYEAEAIRYPKSFQAIYAATYDIWLAGGGDPSRTTFMGAQTDTQALGTYYLRTRDSSLFGLYGDGTQPA